MPANRYYIDASLTKDSEIILEGNEFHHLSRVMRARTGDAIELINGKDTLATAHITTIEKKQARVRIDTVKTKKTTAPAITLAIPLAQSSKLDLIIEKGCELGASAFWIYPAEYSEKKTLTTNQQERLMHLLISAMKQCGRLDLPTLVLKPPLKEWPPFKGRTLFGDTRPTAKPISPTDQTTPILFITGPEKGFTPSELTTLENTLHASGVRLHTNILRMETAPLVALCSLTSPQNH